jgi:hypothetical protein
MRWIATAVAAVLALGAGETAEAAKRPELRIVTTSPLAVRGINVKPAERVRLLVSYRGPLTRTVKAGPRGGFLARLAVSVRGCEPLVVQAIGARGSRAMVDITMPGCGERPE